MRPSPPTRPRSSKPRAATASLPPPREHDTQVAVFRWAALAARVHPPLALLYAVPNAGRRSAGEARWMKAEGLRAGVPDVCLPVPVGGYGALYVEHKRPGNAPEPSQAWWLDQLAAHGNACAVSWSFDQTRSLLLAYLAGRFDDCLASLNGAASR